jgi:hypothetical protein
MQQLVRHVVQRGALGDASASAKGSKAPQGANLGHVGSLDQPATGVFLGRKLTLAAHATQLLSTHAQLGSDIGQAEQLALAWFHG